MFIFIRHTILVALLAVAGGGVGLAQDAAPELSWEEMVKIRKVSFSRLRELSELARKTKPEDRAPLAEEYSKIAMRMQKEIIPGLSEKVVEQIQKSPKDETTIEIANEAMQYAYGQNNYPIVLKVAEAVLKTDPQNDNAVNFSGVANFAEHDFENSNRILNLAKKNGQLIGDLGGQYLNLSKSYIDYWKKEQEIRAKEATATGEEQLPRVKLMTSRGEIILELFENEAPNTVANFISLVEKKYYDGLTFHRVLPNFMAQGGCPFSKTDPELAGSGGPGYGIKCEAYRPDARRHFSGSLSMAHAGKDTGGSQFFITHLPTPHLDRELNPESVHTVFGRVLEGLDVARAIQAKDVIESATVIRKRSHDYTPQTIPAR